MQKQLQTKWSTDTGQVERTCSKGKRNPGAGGQGKGPKKGNTHEGNEVMETQFCKRRRRLGRRRRFKGKEGEWGKRIEIYYIEEQTPCDKCDRYGW